MSFRAYNDAYEAWLRKQYQVVEADLEHKHEKMKKDAFTLLRATFFRWAKTIEKICSDLSDAPVVLSVGDTHVENFGTWRDAEGRLVWGVNDFDEAAVIPYPCMDGPFAQDVFERLHRVIGCGHVSGL